MCFLVGIILFYMNAIVVPRFQSTSCACILAGNKYLHVFTFKKEVSKIMFLHVLQSCDDVMKDQRRLCAHCNTLLAFKQVYDACASTAHSLLCYGPYHEYPIPTCHGF